MPFSRLMPFLYAFLPFGYFTIILAQSPIEPHTSCLIPHAFFLRVTLYASRLAPVMQYITAQLKFQDKKGNKDFKILVFY